MWKDVAGKFYDLNLNFGLFLALTLSLVAVYIIHTKFSDKANIIQMNFQEFFAACLLNIVADICFYLLVFDILSLAIARIGSEA